MINDAPGVWLRGSVVGSTQPVSDRHGIHSASELDLSKVLFNWTLVREMIAHDMTNIASWFSRIDRYKRSGSLAIIKGQKAGELRNSRVNESS